MFLNKIKEKFKKKEQKVVESILPQEKKYHLYITKNNISGEKIEKIVASYTYDEVSNYMYIGNKDFNTRSVGGWIFYDGNYVVINEVKESTNGHTYYIGDINPLGAYEKLDKMPEGQVKDALKTINALENKPEDEVSKEVDKGWDTESKGMQSGMPKPSGISESQWATILSTMKGMD